MVVGGVLFRLVFFQYERREIARHDVDGIRVRPLGRPVRVAVLVADVGDRHAAGDEAAGVCGERHALKRHRLLELRLHRLLEALHVRVVPVAHARRRVAHHLDLALRDFLDELDALVLRLGPDRTQVEVDPDLGRNAIEGGALRLDDRGRQDVRTGELVFTSKTKFSIISPLKNNLNESYSLFLCEFKIKILYDIIIKILKKILR